MMTISYQVDSPRGPMLVAQIMYNHLCVKLYRAQLFKANPKFLFIYCLRRIFHKTKVLERQIVIYNLILSKLSGKPSFSRKLKFMLIYI